MDLADYYHTSEDEAALILQDTISETKGKMVDGEAYLPYSICLLYTSFITKFTG